MRALYASLCAGQDRAAPGSGDLDDEALSEDLDEDLSEDLDMANGEENGNGHENGNGEENGNGREKQNERRGKRALSE